MLIIIGFVSNIVTIRHHSNTSSLNLETYKEGKRVIFRIVGIGIYCVGQYTIQVLKEYPTRLSKVLHPHFVTPTPMQDLNPSDYLSLERKRRKRE